MVIKREMVKNDLESVANNFGISGSKIVEKDSVSLNLDPNKLIEIIDNIISRKDWSSHEKLLISKLLIRDGTNGGSLSIILCMNIIGTTSNKTAINLLRRLENEGVINRVRGDNKGHYTFTLEFLRSIGL